MYMVGFLQRSFYFDFNFDDKASNEVPEYHTTREVPTSLAGNFLPNQNIRYQPENPTQPDLSDRLMIIFSLRTYISSGLKIKKIWQSFVDLIKSSQSLQGISQFFSKKFKGISVAAIQLNAYFSFKRKTIHNNTEIINHNGASKEDIKEMFQETVQVIADQSSITNNALLKENNDLKDELLAQGRTTIKFLSQKNEAQAQKIEEQAQELEVKSRKIELLKNIQAEAFITRSEAHLTLKTITQPSRRRTNSLPPQPVASFN